MGVLLRTAAVKYRKNPKTKPNQNRVTITPGDIFTDDWQTENEWLEKRFQQKRAHEWTITTCYSLEDANDSEARTKLDLVVN